MNQYGVADVERLLRLPRATIRAFVAAGFVTPAKGPRSRWLFSFQDLIVLRTAQALAAANVPTRRLTQSMRELRRHLPDAMPMTGLSIGAEGAHVVVKEGGARWQAESGQYLLAFDGDPASGALSVIERPHPEGTQVRRGWLDEAAVLEEDDPEAAMRVYEKALSAQPALLEAWINLGRLLHERRRFVKAEEVYRNAMKECGSDPVLLYNLGVLLHDLERTDEAIAAYEAALRANPDLADCHYNLALLYEERSRPKDAIRHMARYRVLAAGR